MEFNIIYADDEVKKQRMVNYIREHPGVVAYRILADLGLCNRVYHNLLKELESSGQIVIMKGERGKLHHYCN